MSSKLQATTQPVTVPSARTITTNKATATKASKPVTSAAATKVTPVPKPLRTLAGLFAAMGDPRSLQILGSLSNGLPASLGSLTAALGIAPDEATTCLARLKGQRLVEGIRVEGGKGWSYRITELGSSTWGQAQGFAAQG